MPELQPIAVIQSYAELRDTLRERATSLGFSRCDLDFASDWAEGYAAKVLMPGAGEDADAPTEKDRRKKGRGLGGTALQRMLKSLGLRLIVAVDPEETERAKEIVYGREGRPDPAVTAHYRRVTHKRRSPERAA